MATWHKELHSSLQDRLPLGSATELGNQSFAGSLSFFWGLGFLWTAISSSATSLLVEQLGVIVLLLRVEALVGKDGGVSS